MPDDVYEYKVVYLPFEPALDPDNLQKPTIESAANRWAERGWRTVGVMPAKSLGYADAILIEKKKLENKPVAIKYEYKGETLVLDPDKLTYIYTINDEV